MLNIIPLLASMQNVAICLEKLLPKAQVDAVALVHLNKTVDFADNIYERLVRDTEYAWMRFNMDNKATLKNHLMEKNLINKIFFVYILDSVADWQHDIINFIRLSKLNHRAKQIYIINEYATRGELLFYGYSTFVKQYYNCAFLFWNSSGHGSGMEVYTFNGFQKKLVIKIPVIDDQCSSDIYDQLFFEKETNFHGLNMTFFGNAEPPRIVKTVAMVNGQYAYSIGGHDVLINDVIARHLNATAQYKLVWLILYQRNATSYVAIRKPLDNIEEKVLNVSQIGRYNWEVPDERGYNDIYDYPGVDMISERMNHQSYLTTRRYKHYTFLYPHDIDHFLIIVPKILKSQTEYSQIFKSPLIIVWGPVTLVASILRYIFKKVSKSNHTDKTADESIIENFLQTFGLSLGMSFDETRTSVAEKLLLWWFCLGTVLAGMLLSSSMFQGFSLRMDIPAINNLKELEMSGLEIQLPLYTESVKNYFVNLPVNLKLRYSLEYSISEMISNRNMSYAYVIRARKFNILFKDTDDIWHVIERLGNEYLSYKLLLYSAIEDRMNNLIQRCVEHGIVKHLVAKNKLDLTGSSTQDRKPVGSTIVASVSVNEMKDPLLLFAVGVALSSMAFIVEGIRKCFTKPRGKSPKRVAKRVTPKMKRVAPKVKRVTPKVKRVVPKMKRVAPKVNKIARKWKRVKHEKKELPTLISSSHQTKLIEINL